MALLVDPLQYTTGATQGVSLGKFILLYNDIDKDLKAILSATEAGTYEWEAAIQSGKVEPALVTEYSQLR